jgi:hypothetical protein
MTRLRANANFSSTRLVVLTIMRTPREPLPSLRFDDVLTIQVFRGDILIDRECPRGLRRLDCYDRSAMTLSYAYPSSFATRSTLLVAIRTRVRTYAPSTPSVPLVLPSPLTTPRWAA